MPRRQVNVDLLHLTGPFDRWCTQLGKSRSAVLRELLAKAMGEPMAEAEVQTAAQDKSPARVRTLAAPRRHISVRMLDCELTVLRRQAAAAGLPAAGYLLSLLKAANAGRIAIAGNDAVHALTESNHQLAWIGRNLHQAARLLHSAPAQGTQSGIESVGEAIGLVRQHLACAAAVLADVERTRTWRGAGPRHASGSREAKGDDASAR